MGIFGDILEVVEETGEYVTGDWGERWKPVGEAAAGVQRTFFPIAVLDQGRRGGPRKAGEEGDIDDVVATLLRIRSEDVLALARNVQTPEDLEAFEAAQADLAAFAANVPNLREQARLLEALPEFDEDSTAEEVINAIMAATPSLEAEEGVTALTPEDQAFADLQTRSMGLDVELKEQQLTSEKMANRQAGMMSLLNMLPASARAGTIATIMETPALRDELFPGLFGGAGGAPAPGGTAEGDVIDILTQFGGGE